MGNTELLKKADDKIKQLKKERRGERRAMRHALLWIGAAVAAFGLIAFRHLLWGQQ